MGVAKRTLTVLLIVGVTACGGGGGGDSAGATNGGTNTGNNSGGGNNAGQTCTNTCTTAGATRCSGAQVETCSADSAGCLRWSDPASCSNAGFCNSVTNQCTAPLADACGGVPASGLCAGTTAVTACSSVTGSEPPRIVTYDCAQGESCQINAKGEAKCTLTAACAEGSQVCSGSDLKTCINGAYTTETCSNGCDTNPLGAFCVPNIPFGTFTARLKYQSKLPNSTFTDWNPIPATFDAMGMLIISAGANGVIYDATYTSMTAGQEGTFSVRVPQSPTVSDTLFALAAADDGAGGIAFAVANPGFAAGEQVPLTPPPAPSIWYWSAPFTTLTSGQDVTIPVAAGSWAARIHQNLAAAYLYTYYRYNRPGKPIVVWVGPEVSWSCGACFGAVPTTAFDTRFATQMWLGGDSLNEPYWSDAVTQHEFGHWAMDTYGTSPGEGGTHIMGNPTFPGQAWSEGFATWFSSDLRGNGIYYDKQNGAMFWIDLTRLASSSGPLVVPSASSPEGVLQKMDENTVAAMLLAVSTSSSTASQSIYAALSSGAMTLPPYGRGYTRHTWDLVNGPAFVNVVDTGESKPVLADLMDALNCAGFPRSTIEAVTQPTVFFPYPSQSPICR